jgi:hypothetical protein
VANAIRFINFSNIPRLAFYLILVRPAKFRGEFLLFPDAFDLSLSLEMR